VLVRRLTQHLRCALALAACLAFTQCGADDPVPDARACELDAAECLDSERLRVCVGGVWTLRRCDEDCAARPAGGLSTGCNLRDGPDDCACSTTQACEGEGPLACASSRYIVHCESGRPQIALCDCSDPVQVSLGCQYPDDDQPSCACASLGTPCHDAAWDQCVGDSAIARCEDGIWTVTECTDICAPAPSAGCLFSTLRAESACACEQA
jgi:hypothetical protein